MDAAMQHIQFESLVLAAGMTAFADDCDRIVIRRLEAYAPVAPTFLDDSDFLPPTFEK
jgi:hypothetical protein